jgi:hypothetical protein
MDLQQYYTLQWLVIKIEIPWHKIEAARRLYEIHHGISVKYSICIPRERSSGNELYVLHTVIANTQPCFGFFRWVRRRQISYEYQPSISGVHHIMAKAWISVNDEIWIIKVACRVEIVRISFTRFFLFLSWTLPMRSRGALTLFPMKLEIITQNCSCWWETVVTRWTWLPSRRAVRLCHLPNKF